MVTGLPAPVLGGEVRCGAEVGRRPGRKAPTSWGARLRLVDTVERDEPGRVAYSECWPRPSTSSR